MLPISRATLSVAARMGEGGAGDGVGRSCCPCYLQPTEVTPSCGWCHCPRVPGCPMGHPGRAEPCGVTLGMVTTPQDHQPLLDRLLPYSWPGLPRSGEPRKRETPCHGPTVPGERSGQSGRDLPALPPPTSIPLLPGASRGEEPRACGKEGSQGALCAAASPSTGWSPPKPQGSHRRALGRGGRAEPEYPTWGGGAMEVYPGPSPISTSTSRLQISWKRLNTRQE